MAEEWADHVEDIREELRSSGLTPERAEAESLARMGSAERAAAEYARLARSRSPVGRLPLASSLALPFLLAGASVAAAILVSGLAGRFLAAFGFAHAVRAVALMPAVWDWMVPVSCGAPAALAICLLFRRAFCAAGWSCLSCLLFSLLAGSFQWSVAVPASETASVAGYSLSIGFTLSTRVLPLVVSVPALVRFLVPLIVSAAFVCADRSVRERSAR